MLREELIDELKTTGAEAVATLAALPPATFEQGRYESGWNARQILAHIAAIEWTYPRLLDLARGADQSAAPGAEGTTPRRTMTGGVDGYNARQVEKRAERDVQELIDEFAANRAATIAAVEAADESLLASPITSAGGISGSVAEVLRAVAIVHVASHVRDIATS